MWGVTKGLAPAMGRGFAASQSGTYGADRPPAAISTDEHTGGAAGRASEVNPRRLNEIVTSMAGLRTTVTKYDVRA